MLRNRLCLEKQQRTERLIVCRYRHHSLAGQYGQKLRHLGVAHCARVRHLPVASMPAHESQFIQSDKLGCQDI